MIFLTYQIMLNAIDETKAREGKKLFTPGHFDLIIVDAPHRSIYKKYKDIFDYFEVYLLGLIATQDDEIEKILTLYLTFKKVYLPLHMN